ncbi:ribosomal protein S18-alanine N-acetyltransferase [Lactobacillus melliventris]|uniref:Ribosomal protein Ala-acetyltransferase n=1 Tax=Lactobacillus melliventris TaxID=1218507 RepID=A0A0F4LC88_9LACO|nr:ribosomal protein S18-alanine N-acetyltransferase [Lactobacillus melliventris]KJY56225.1 Ribosomal protein Ala-acetyltransferase [Lactobacillus melliventris]
MWKKFKYFWPFLFVAPKKKFVDFIPEKFIINHSILNIRQAQIEDISAILLLEQSLYQGEEPWSGAIFQTELGKKNSLYLLVLQSQLVVGLIGVRINNRKAHITNLMVDSAWQKRGIGTYLIRKVIKAAQEQNCEEVSLEVREDNLNAQKLYQKLGFVTTFVWPNYYQDSKQNAFNMVLKLASD